MQPLLRASMRLAGRFVSLCLLVSACGGNKTATRKDPDLRTNRRTIEERSRCKAIGKHVVRLDLNQDKQPDVWKIYTTKMERGARVDVLACKERDLNFDGRKDTWYYYDENGNVKMEEMDVTFDGRIDLVTYRRGGKIIRKELDTNHDGKIDVWQYFEEGVLTKIDRDSNHDGKVDYWEYYEGGQLDRIGYDDNGDGLVDRWDRAGGKR